MASSGSKSTVFSGNTLRWSWEVASLSPDTQEATISWKAEIIASSSVSYKGYTLDVMDYDKVQGNTYTGSIGGSVSAGVTKQIATGTFVVGHTTAAYGRTSADFTIVVSNTNIRVSCSFTLDSPVRGAKILSAPNFTDEQNPTIEYSLDYLSVTSVTGQIIVGDYTLSRTIPIAKTGSYTFSLTSTERTAIRNRITTSNSGTAKFKLITKASGVDLTHEQSRTVTIVNAAPILAPSYTNNTGYTYILASNNSITVKVNATAQKGATIVSQSIVCGNQQINSGTGTLTNISSNQVQVTATDSRGNQTATSLTIDMIGYIDLTCNIETTNPIRNANGTITATFKISGAFYNGSFNDGGSGNALSLHYRTTIDGDTGDWEWFSGTISGNKYTATLTFTVVSGQSLSLEVYAQDNIKTVTASSINKGMLPTFDWSRDDFNFNVPVTIEGCTVPYIVASGGFYSNGDFYWRKWSDGTSELWGECSFSTAFNTAWGSLYTSGAISASNISFPSGLFNATPAIVAQLRTRSTGAFLMVPGGSGSNISSSTNTGPYELVRPAQYSTTSAFTICYNIKGRWK